MVVPEPRMMEGVHGNMGMLEVLRRMVPGGRDGHLETGDAEQMLVRKCACECGQPPFPPTSLCPPLHEEQTGASSGSWSDLGNPALFVGWERLEGTCELRGVKGT